MISTSCFHLNLKKTKVSGPLADVSPSFVVVAPELVRVPEVCAGVGLGWNLLYKTVPI